MKRRLIPILFGLLLVQIALAIALGMGETQKFSAFKSSEPLLDVNAAEIDGLEITDSQNHSIHLKRKDGHWVLPAEDDFPADNKLVEKLVNKLLGLKKSWPVATTEEAAKRFKVTEKAFERKIELLSGHKSLATLYLGTSPGFRKIHARVAGHKEILAIEMGTYEAQATLAAWEDKEYLHVPPDNLKVIEIAGITLTWDGQKPHLQGLGEDEALDETKANDLINSVLTLPFRSVLGKKRPEGIGDKPVLTFTLKLKDGKSRTYEFYKYKKARKGANYVLKVSSFPYYFMISDFTFDDLKGYNRKMLVKKKESNTAKDSGAAGKG